MHTKKRGRMLCGHPAIGALGCLHVAIKSVRWGSDLPVTRVIANSPRAGNNAKRLECELFCNSFSFSYLMGLAACQALILFASSARPINRYPLHLFAFPNSERHRQFALRQVTRPAAHDSRLRQASRENLHRSADGVAIRFRPRKLKADAP